MFGREVTRRDCAVSTDNQTTDNLPSQIISSKPTNGESSSATSPVLEFLFFLLPLPVPVDTFMVMVV